MSPPRSLVASAGGAYLYSKHHMRSLLATAQTTALAEGDLIRVALEHQMIENDRTLIAAMIEQFPQTGARGAAGAAGPLRKGTIPARQRPTLGRRISTSTPPPARLVTVTGRTARSPAASSRPGRGRASHRHADSQSRGSATRCHDPNHKVNGILILDYKAEELRAEMNRDLGWLVAGTGGITLLLVGAIAIVIRFAVLKRLQRFETAARQIAAGDLGRSVPAEGSDTLSWLAREFNTMADSVTGLVGEVRTPARAAGDRDQQHRRRDCGARSATQYDRRQRCFSAPRRTFPGGGAGLLLPQSDIPAAVMSPIVRRLPV